MQKWSGLAHVVGYLYTPPGEEGEWGLSRYGALFRSLGGRRIFYASGEVVSLSDKVSFTVKRVMGEDELRQLFAAAATGR